MSNLKDVGFCFLCKGKEEKYICSWYTSEIIDGFDSTNTKYIKPLGTCFCSLLNSLDELKNLQNKFNKNTNNYFVANNISNSITNIYNSLVNINTYFSITKFTFNDCILRINKIQTQNTNIDLFDIYKNEVSKILDNIARSILYMKEILQFKKLDVINLPSTTIKYNLTNKKLIDIQYNYIVRDIFELLRVSYYQIILNKLYIKQCKYPNCYKYFITSTGQTRYCDNPCPDNSSKTCRTIRRTIDHSTEEQEPWEEDLVKLNKYKNVISTRFYDGVHKSKKKTSREKEYIVKNHQKFKNISNELIRYIKTSKSTKRIYYFNVYEKFLNEIDNNTNSIPKIFKIKKPKY